MPERGHEGVRLAGVFSQALGRERLTLSERGTTEIWVVFRHRASTALLRRCFRRCFRR